MSMFESTKKSNLLKLELIIANAQYDLREEYLGIKKENPAENLPSLICTANIIHSLIFLDRYSEVKKIDRIRFDLL